jgi:hypothetical protein
MQPTIQNLERIIHTYSKRLAAVPAAAYAEKSRPEKWSKQEILGHLIDSAQNNIRRFVVAQYEDDPAIAYDQDAWVRCAGYQAYAVTDMVSLWVLLNKHIVVILRKMSPEMAQRKCTMSGQSQSLDWVAADYCNHLLHHLHQILDLDAIAYPG